VAITAAQVRQLPGIGEVTGDMRDNSLIVEYDPGQVTAEAIAQSITQSGFTVEGTFAP